LKPEKINIFVMVPRISRIGANQVLCRMRLRDMSLKRNAVANYAGQGYSALIGIIVLPLYLEFLGAEAFGLVGFFIVLQTWLYLLDMGLSPTLAREVAFAKGLEDGLHDFGKLLRSFESIFLFIGLAVAVGVYSVSDVISTRWIESQTISQEVVSYCISLMGGVVALRFFASLYRSGIRGMEDQVWLNVANVLISSVRVIGALLLMIFVSTEITLFFRYQIAVGLLEILILAARFYRNLSLSPLGLPLTIHWPSLRRVAPFAASVAYAAVIWIIVSQSDKLILSAVLPLREFGYFSLVGLIVGGILVVTNPITQAILPRMTSLLAAGRQEEMLHVYRNASQLVAVIAVSVALVIAFNAEALIYAWTGDRDAAAWCATVLPWFILGNGLLALGAFQYYLQNAFGQLRLHVIGTTISAILQVPIIYFAATTYGAYGAGVAWLVIRSVLFLIWTPIVHSRFVPGLHKAWMFEDLLPTMVVGAITIAVLVNVVSIDLAWSRVEVASYLGFLGIVMLCATVFSSKFARSSVLTYFSEKMPG
jgi:O-antigen/teichoic acid export membrane protein